MGRTPQPSKIRLITGNPGKRPINKQEPQPAEGIPKKPKNFLTEEASAEWDRIVPQLTACGLLTHLDFAALLGYCMTYSDYIMATREVQRLGPVITCPNGALQKNPYMAQANASLKLLRGFMADFGLSPASRSRVTVAEGSEDDPLKKYSGKK